MTTIATAKPTLKKLGAIKRKSVSVTQENLIKSSPNVEGLNLTNWIEGNHALVNEHLLTHGGILFRNWHVKSIEEFEHFTQVAAGEDLLDYVYRSTPRSAVSGKVYSSTEYPADEWIPLHNEMAYTSTWPLRIWFYSVIVAEEGGATPIADSRKIYNRLDPGIRDRFAKHKVMYVRNYGGGLDLSWQNVFQTEDKAAVEAFCHDNGIEFEWKTGDRLRTRQICQGVARHPQTGEMVWFNQAHLFHVSSLKPEIRDQFLAEFKEEDLPRNTYYGDGSPIEPDVLAAIRQAMQEETIIFPWQQGDILMLDNMLAAHGRSPFRGKRKVVVTMAGPYSEDSAEEPGAA
jgi:alpha-ketoglutarate-dependent taurine dioxygenase